MKIKAKKNIRKRKGSQIPQIINPTLIEQRSSVSHSKRRIYLFGRSAISGTAFVIVFITVKFHHDIILLERTQKKILQKSE